MKIPKAKLFSPSDLANLRLGFYTQAPTLAGLIISQDEDSIDVEWTARLTVEMIEALIAEISEVTI